MKCSPALVEGLTRRLFFPWVAVRDWVYGESGFVEAFAGLAVLFLTAIGMGTGLADPLKARQTAFALETYTVLVEAHRKDLLPAVAGLPR